MYCKDPAGHAIQQSETVFVGVLLCCVVVCQAESVVHPESRWLEPYRDARVDANKDYYNGYFVLTIVSICSACVRGCAHTNACIWGQKTRFLLPWVPGVKLKLPGLIDELFTTGPSHNPIMLTFEVVLGCCVFRNLLLLPIFPNTDIWALYPTCCCNPQSEATAQCTVGNRSTSVSLNKWQEHFAFSSVLGFFTRQL